MFYTIKFLENGKYRPMQRHKQLYSEWKNVPRMKEYVTFHDAYDALGLRVGYGVLAVNYVPSHEDRSVK